MLIPVPLGLLLWLAAAPVHHPVDGSQVHAIQCATPYYYVGTTETEPLFKVDRVFRVANRGPSPVRIASAEAACGCSQRSRLAYDIRFDPEIQAQSETDLRIGYQTAPVAGVPDIREFLIRFENTREPALSLTVLAKRLDELTVFPGMDLILRHELRKPASKTLYLVARDRKDLRVEPTGPPLTGLSIRLTLIDKADNLQIPASVWKNGRVAALLIEADPSMGATNARVPLKTNLPGFEEIVLKLAIF